MSSSNNNLSWRAVLLLLVCGGLVACSGPVAPAVHTTTPPQPTTMSATATTQPTPTVPATVTPTATTAPTQPAATEPPTPSPELLTVPPPPGLTYQFENQIFAVSAEGITAVFQETGEPADAYLPNPTNSYLLVLHRDSEMVNRLAQATLIELATRAERPLEPPYLVAVDSIGWLDEATLGMGVWLDEEDALGQTPGRPLTFDINSGEWTLLTDHHATISQMGDGRMVYTNGDEFVVWRETGATSYLLTAGGLPTLSHSEQQWILRTSSQFTLVNTNTAEQTELLAYRAAHPQGSFIAQVAWSPDDRWVALRTSPTDLEMDGIWLYSLDEEEMIFLGSGTTNPLWQDNQVVLFNALVEGEMVLHAYDVNTAGRVSVDVPAGSVPLHFVPAGE